MVKYSSMDSHHLLNLVKVLSKVSRTLMGSRFPGSLALFNLDRVIAMNSAMSSISSFLEASWSLGGAHLLHRGIDGLSDPSSSDPEWEPDLGFPAGVVWGDSLPPPFPPAVPLMGSKRRRCSSIPLEETEDVASDLLVSLRASFWAYR